MSTLQSFTFTGKSMHFRQHSRESNSLLLNNQWARNLKQEARLLLGDRATRKPAKDCWNGRGNDNLGWTDLEMYFKVINKVAFDWKLVYDFLLVLCSNFCRTVYEKFDVKQFNDLEISPRSSTFVSAESRRLISYISNFSFCGHVPRYRTWEGEMTANFRWPWIIFEGH